MVVLPDNQSVLPYIQHESYDKGVDLPNFVLRLPVKRCEMPNIALSSYPKGVGMPYSAVELHDILLVLGNS